MFKKDNKIWYGRMGVGMDFSVKMELKRSIQNHPKSNVPFMARNKRRL